MNIKELKKDIQKSFLPEYTKNIRNAETSKTLYNTGKAIALTAVAVGLVATFGGVGVALLGAKAAATTITTIGFSSLGTALAVTAGTEGVRSVGKIIAAQKLKKDALTPELLERFKTEIIPNKKRILRTQAGVQIENFNAEREMRMETYQDYKDVIALDAGEYAKAFNDKNTRKTDVAEVVQKATASAPTQTLAQNQ